MALKLIPNLFQSSGNSNTPRCSPRVTPDPLLTIRLPEGNQGIVLDLSEEGLGFLAAAPIDNGRSIRFVLADRSNRRSEATGELMWKDSAGKRGGLRFTEVSSELRKLIQFYLGQEDSTAVGAKDPLPPGFESPDSFSSQAHAGILPDVEPRKPRNWNLAANATTVLAATLVAAAIWYNIDGQRKVPSLDTIRQYVTKFVFTKVNHVPFGWTPKLDWHAQKSEKPHAAAPNTSSAAEPTAQIPSATTVAPLNPEPNAQPATENPQSAASAVTSPAAPVAPPSTPTLAATAATPVTVPRPAAEVPAKEKISPAQVVAKTEVAARVPEPPASPAAVEDSDDVAAARKLLTNQTDAANQSKGIRMLWQAVAKGNPAAEVELAGLYLSGTGVSKSCSQAMVLLKAAQSRKSASAEQKLAELPQFGCAREDNSPASLKPAVDSDR